MTQKIQTTALHRIFGKAFDRLDVWASNPWRRYSLFIIVFLTSFFFGSSVGMINGVLALMDPIGAFFTVAILELMVRLRRVWTYSKRESVSLKLMDVSRMGLLYGLLIEGFKLA